MELYDRRGVPIRHAEDIRFENAASGLAAQNVQAAIDEIVSEFTENAQDAVASALTDTASIVWTYTDGADTIEADISPTYAGQTSITTLGTITTGVWNGTPITLPYIDEAITPTWTGIHEFSTAPLIVGSTVAALSGVTGLYAGTNSLYAVGASANIVRAANTATLNLYRVNTSLAAPSAIANGSTVVNVNFGGYDGTTIATGATLRGVSTEAWNNTARGMECRVLTVTTGTTTLAERARFGGNSTGGYLQIPDGTAGQPGLGFLSQATTGFFRSGSGVVGYSAAGTLAVELLANPCIRINSTQPRFQMYETDVAADTGRVEFLVSGGSYFIRSWNDADNAGENAYVLTRGTTTAWASHTWRTAGTDRLTLNTTDLTSTLRVTAPSFIPNSSTVPSNGLFLAASNTPAISAGNARACAWDANGRYLNGTLTSIPVGTNNYQLQIHGAGTVGLGVVRYSANSSGPIAGFAKSRGTSVGAFDAVTTSDNLGAFNWYGADGTNLETQAAGFQAAVDGTVSTGIIPGRMEIYTSTAGGVSTRAFIVNSSQQALHTDGTAGLPSISFINSTTTGFYRSAADTIGVSCAATLRAHFSTTAFHLVTDNYELQLGTGTAGVGDLRLYHDSTNSVIRNDTGVLKVQQGATEVARFDSDSTAGNTRFMLYDVDNGTLERVSVGAADSGGTGFKLLRIPN